MKMKTQIASHNQINLNTNKKLDELNSLLMSHIESDSKCTHNLTNLRDVLKTAHKTTQSKINPEDSLNILIEFLKLDQIDSTSNNNSIDAQKQHKQIQPEAIINRIENDLQESLKLLKQYNDNLDQVKSDETSMEDFFYKKTNSKYTKIRSDSNENIELMNEDDNETHVYNFNRNDIIRKNFFNKNENFTDKLKKYSQLNKKNSISETSKMIDNSTQPVHRESQSFKRVNLNSQRRKSFDQTSFTNYHQRPQTLTKSSTAQFNYEKINQLDDEQRIDNVKHTESGFWNYDELNELKQKFISLLGESNSTSEQISNQNKDNLDVCCMVQNPPNRLSSMSFVALDFKPISSLEQLKIESFYRSFGTSLFISQSCASLYTICSKKLPSDNTNRASIVTTHSIKFSPETNQIPVHDEISHEILKDLMNNRHQNYVPVYHRGVPLWLFNSGKNPHRPVRQLKFTLAEKGTGFILWQDRIDSNSDFNLYLTKKNDLSVHNVSSYFDNLSLINEIKQEQIESMLVTFRASDKKTTVFMKFDINTETIKFYEFYKRLIKNVMIDTKHRTKSLPVGIGNTGPANKIKRNSNGRTNVSFYNYDYNLLDSPYKTKYKRQSCQIVPESQEKIKFKRISKNDISNPCNYKHIISLKSTDKNMYYTLSKLLPDSVSCQNSSVSSPYSIGNKSIISPSYSIASSVSSPLSSPITPSSNVISSDFLIQESSRSSFNQDSSNDHSTSSLSDSSLSSILPSLLGATTTNKFLESSSYNHKIAKQRTVK